MAKPDDTFDVFVAFDHRDKQHATQIADFLRSYGLSVFVDTQVARPANEDLVWEALAECRALVVVLPKEINSAWLAFEIGAASAWNKPIYAIATNPSSPRLPYHLENSQVLPISRVDEVAQAIQASKELISYDDLPFLVDAYHKVGVPVDQLAIQPQQLAKLVKDFNRRSGKKTSNEEVLMQLIRTRKRGKLLPLKKQASLSTS